MAQTGYTPIQLYRSATASAAPTAGNLADGELALNTADGKLFYKDSGGTVQVLATKAGANGTVTSVEMTTPTGLTVTGSPITSSGTLAVSFTAGYSIPTTTKQTEWDSAYTQRLQWDGGSTNLVAATGRTSLGATTAGSSFFTLTNPSAITFPRINADNTVSALSAADFRTAIGAGTGAGTVTSVGGTGTVNGITLTGTVTSSGNLTLGGTLSGVSLTTQVSGTLPVANGGTGITSFGTGVATALGQNVTGSGSIALATAPTLSGPTINDGYTEEVFAVSGTTPALSPTNGSIQTWTLSGASTPTAGTWAAGQSLTLMIDDGTAYTVNWSSVAVTWKTNGGSAPTLNTTGYTVIQLWKVGTTIYGARVGDA